MAYDSVVGIANPGEGEIFPHLSRPVPVQWVPALFPVGKAAVEKILTHRTENRSTTSSAKFEKSGIYKLTCPDCNLKYIGQTGHSFLTRYQEHFRNYKYNNKNSKYAHHLLDVTTPLAPSKAPWKSYTS